MKAQRSMQAIAVLGFVAAMSLPATAVGAEPDWRAVEQALGKPGQLLPGDVFRIGMPRTDLAVISCCSIRKCPR